MESAFRSYPEVIGSSDYCFQPPVGNSLDITHIVNLVVLPLPFALTYIHQSNAHLMIICEIASQLP